MATLPNVNMTAAEVQAVTPTPDDQTEASVITKAIMGVFDAYAEPAFASDDANAALNGTDTQVGAREQLLLDAAELSIAGDWDAKHFVTGKTGDVLDAALEAWSAGKNRLPTTLSQFKVELRRAVQPSSRAYVEDAYNDTRVAWDAERADAKAAKAAGTKHDAPLMKAFAKRYHMWAGSKGVLQAHIDADKPAPKAGTPDKRLAADHEDAADPHTIAGTRQTAERVDPKAAARMIAKLVKALQAIETEFPVPAIGQMISFAAALDATTLANAKNAKMQELHRAAKAKPAPAVTRTPKVSQPALDEVIEDLVSE